ncbi:MAG: porin [Deltaproteobacteria bacterium]|nr:porin [Deltaproteobacteria bacterium]
MERIRRAVRSLVATLVVMSTFGSFGSAVFAEDAPGAVAGTPGAGSTLEELDRKVRILERKWEIEQEAAAAKAKGAVNVTAGKDGFSIRSADGSFQLKLNGYVHADARFFFDDKQQPAVNTFLIRRARPNVEGTVSRYVAFRILVDFGEGKSSLQDAYADFTYFPNAKLRAGKFKSPVGLERLQSVTDARFVELALPTSLVPNRDIGFLLHGSPWKGALSYAVGVVNGVADGGSGDGDNHDDKDGVARLFVHPFRAAGIDALSGLGLGVGASYGNRQGSVSDQNLPTYKTPGQQTFFKYRNGTDNVFADGANVRISPQGYFYYGPLGLFGEYVRSTQEVRKLPSTVARLTNTSWQAAGYYLLTGEDESYGAVAPRRPFDPVKGDWGAWEVAARYSELRVDDDAFPTFASPTSAVKKASAWAGGINWYVNRNAKVALTYEETKFTGGASVGDREKERVLLSRVQLAY